MDITQETKIVFRESSRFTDGFIRGPLDYWWFAFAGTLPGKVLHVGLMLWYEVGLTNSKTVTLSQEKMRHFGVKRNAAYRAIKIMEEHGLITVTRHRGRLYRVTITD